MIKYRDYQDSDWQAICRIHDRARPDELVGSCDPRGFIPIEQDEEVEDLKQHKKFVACENDKVVGLLAWTKIISRGFTLTLIITAKASGVSCSASASVRSAKVHGQLCSMGIKKPSPCMRAKAFGKSAVLKVTTMDIHVFV
jgi:hypothetical protein